MTDENKTPENKDEPKEPQGTTKLTDHADKPEPKKDEDNDNKEIPLNEDGDDKKDDKPIEVEKPEGIPEELWDKENGRLLTDKTVEELNKQTKIATDFRKKISKGLKADLPEKAEDYAIEFDKDLSELKINENKEMKKEIDVAKAAAFKSGIGKSQLNDFMNNYFKQLVESGVIKKPLTEAEQKIENQKYESEQLAKLGDNAKKIITGVAQFIEGQFQKGLFSESEKDIAIKFIDQKAEHVLLFDKMRQQLGEPEIPITNAKIDGLPSDKEIMRKRGAGEYTEEQYAEVMAKRIKAGRPQEISLEDAQG